MKARKMTNESLARWLETATFNYGVLLNEAIHEAAARLRRPTPVDDDLLKMAGDIEKKDAEIAKLRTLTTHTDNSEVIAELERKYADACKCCDNAERRLKVAEDALKELQARCVASVHDGTIDPYEALKIAEDALAAIRGEGGAK